LLNLVGLIPLSVAVTSQFIFTLYFSISICLGIFFRGLMFLKIKFLKIFLPEVPLILYPLMIIIELFSYIIRAFSLGIRLSANIMAGHILLHIFMGALLNLIIFSFDITVFVFVVIAGLFLLEFGVACLQAYVFVLLVCMYLKDTISITH
jgi:F-type H+-transporting ATPase subunit a